jgi:hypothetical protein
MATFMMAKKTGRGHASVVQMCKQVKAAMQTISSRAGTHDGRRNMMNM